MVTNAYFNRFGTESELALQEDLLVEYIQMDGVDTIYLPKVLLTEDDILNEIVHSYHSRGMMIEMLPETYEDYENNSMELSKFGLSAMPNEAIFVVSRRRFSEAVDDARLRIDGRPNEGDLIYVPNIQEIFVIRKVNKSNPYTSKDRWTLQCEKYEDQNNVNIDLLDYSEDAGAFDTNYDAGIGDFIATNDEVEELIRQLEGAEEGNVYEIDPEASAFVNEVLEGEQNIDEKRLENLQTVEEKSQGSGKNEVYEISGDSLIIKNPDDPHIKEF